MIPLIQPPRSFSAEECRWQMEMFQFVATSLERLEAQVQSLQKEVEALKANP